MSSRPHWTIQLVPGSRGRVQTFHISRRAAVVVLAVPCAAALFVLASIFGFLGERHTSEEVASLRTENRHLERSLSAAETRTAELARALDELSAREQRFRVLAGLPLLESDIYDVGVGGPGLEGLGPTSVAGADVRPELSAATRTLDLDVDRLLRKARLLAASLDEATDSVTSRYELFQTRPSINPVASSSAWFSSGFSFSRLHPLLGYRRPHPGIDISAPPGSPVVATARGTVVFAGRSAGYGGLVEVDHGNGYRTRYAHLGSVMARPGQRVERGEIVGEVGRSGLATGPNLHYEVLVDGRQVNPWEYLLDRQIRH